MPINADFTHALTGLKNYPSWSQLNADGKVASGELAAAYGGRAAHYNASGQFELGAQGTQMPLFLTQSSTSLDVATDATNSYGGAIVPDGSRGALVATGAYELESTEYDASKSWAPNDPIYSPTAAQIGGTSADKLSAGMLYKNKNWPNGGNAAATPGTDKVVAVASWGRRTASGPAVVSPAYTSPNLVSVLAFWPVYTLASN